MMEGVGLPEIVDYKWNITLFMAKNLWHLFKIRHILLLYRKSCHSTHAPLEMNQKI